jgi:hypothetical protein
MSAWTVDMVARLMVRNRDRALCPDSVVRVNLDVAAKESAVEYVRKMNAAGEVCAAIIFAPGNKKLRVAVYPKTLELPKPQWSARYETQEEARAAVQQERIQHPARYVRGMEAKAGGFVVESWEPWDYLRQEMYPCWTVEEIVGAHVDYGAGGADIEFHRHKAKERGLDHLKAGAAQRKAEQRAEFQRLKEAHPDWKKKESFLREIAKVHPRKTGWKLRTLKKNLAGVK